jgi:hypothetical protein
MLPLKMLCECCPLSTGLKQVINAPKVNLAPNKDESRGHRS